MEIQPSTSAEAIRERARARQWVESLLSDTEVVDHTGVQAAMLSVRLRKSSDRVMTQLQHLLERLMADTDRIEQTSSSSFSVLLTPQPNLHTTVAQVRSIAEAIDAAGIETSTGFAHRRPGESLLDTWARAEAQLDRAAYRAEHHDGLTL